MINGTFRHSLVVIKTKLIVIGHSKNQCEVFENTRKKFAALKSDISVIWFHNDRAVKIGNRIYVFVDNTSRVMCYNVETNQWSKPMNHVKFLKICLII